MKLASILGNVDNVGKGHHLPHYRSEADGGLTTTMKTSSKSVPLIFESTLPSRATGSSLQSELGAPLACLFRWRSECSADPRASSSATACQAVSLIQSCYSGSMTVTT